MLPLTYSGFEVYETGAKITDETTQETKEKDSDSSNNVEETSETKKELERFIAQNGEIKEIAYYTNMYDNDFDEDYAGISNTGNVSLPEIDQSRFFKGKKVCLKKANNTGDGLKWEDLESVLLGFISEQTFTTEGVDVKLVGMSKLLDQEKEFSFTDTKRSQVLKEIIEAAGLKAKIDATGLNDDPISYTNISSSGSSGEDYSGEVSADIAEAAKQICQGKTSCLDKAKAIWKWCHDNMTYQGYPNSQKGAERCFKERSGNCCDHANVVVQMLKAVNVKCAYEHSGTCYGTGHVWAVADCGGKTYRIDASVKSRSFDQVGNGCTGTRKESLGF